MFEGCEALFCLFGIGFVLVIVLVVIRFTKKDNFSQDKTRGYRIEPIQFAIPASMFRNVDTKKKRKFSKMIPGESKTYIYNTEKEYYDQYNESKFAITKSKAGHDCLRHYEIIAAGSIPYYEDIDKIPANTMHRFPKEIIKNAMKEGGDYDKSLRELQDYARKHLTTRALAEYFLTTIDYKKGQNVLLVSQPYEVVHTDYQRDCLAIGLIETIGDNVYFYEDLPWLFDDYETCQKNYGKGFSLCGKLDHKDHRVTDKVAVMDGIKNSKYDTVILSTSSNMTKFDKDVRKLLESHIPQNLVLIIGNDGYHYSKNFIKGFVEREYPEFSNLFKFVFVRELKD